MYILVKHYGLDFYMTKTDRGKSSIWTTSRAERAQLLFFDEVVLSFHRVSYHRSVVVKDVHEKTIMLCNNGV